MDFFAQQDQARKQNETAGFLFRPRRRGAYRCRLFRLAGRFCRRPGAHHRYGGRPQFVLWDPQLFLGVTVGVLAVIFLGSAYKTNELSGGGSAVADVDGRTPRQSEHHRSNERKLLNVVEEMAIASGVPMPQVYVLDEERGINAFAAGHTTGDAAIGVTRGCIEMLSRDELQGVIGHEFSHILNGDMRLNLRLIGIIFGLLCLATIGRILFSARSGSSRGQNPLADCSACAAGAARLPSAFFLAV